MADRRGDAGWSDGALDLRLVPPAATPPVLDGYRDVGATDEGFEARVRWDQLGYACRRADEPAYADRSKKVLAVAEQGYSARA